MLLLFEPLNHHHYHYYILRMYCILQGLTKVLTSSAYLYILNNRIKVLQLLDCGLLYLLIMSSQHV